MPKTSRSYDDERTRTRQQRLDDRIDELLAVDLTDPHEPTPAIDMSTLYQSFACPRCHGFTLLGWRHDTTECYYCDNCGAEIRDGVVQRRHVNKERKTDGDAH